MQLKLIHFRLKALNGIIYACRSMERLDIFSSASICLVLASTIYKEADYIRDYQTFEAWKS